MTVKTSSVSSGKEVTKHKKVTLKVNWIEQINRLKDQVWNREIKFVCLLSTEDLLQGVLQLMNIIYLGLSEENSESN